MSITGHSNPFRGKRRTPDKLSETFSQNVLARSTQSAGDANQFSAQQSALKQSLPPKIQHQLMRARDSDTKAQHTHITIPEIPKAQDSNRANGHSHPSETVKRPAIVVIHPRAFFRDCFVRCLEISYQSHEVFAFENISVWKEARDQDALEPSIVVFFAESNSPSSSIDLQCLETAAAGIPIVIMSDSDDATYVTRALKGGARGYIPTSLPFNVAVEAVRLVEAGGTFVPVSSLDLNRDKLGTAAKANDLLTQRQLMVVEALCQGMANKQIAYELSMSEHTVKVHLRHIMRKLNARNRTEVAVLTKDFF
ncbi:DNA-binding NarL/FixJ family response regulator [Nitrobacteraceae bacterium AZCC 1564]